MGATPSALRWLVAAVVAGLLAAPLGMALLVAAVAAPALPNTEVTCTAQGATAGPWRAPFGQTYVRTSPFGMRLHPTKHRWRLHAGTDLASLPGPGPVLAASAGTVQAAGFVPSYGNRVDIDHGRGVLTRYAHLAAITPGIRTGRLVAAGQVLGVEGSTGTATGNHLHFEVRLHGRPVDPVQFMAARGAPLDGRPPTAPSTPATVETPPRAPLPPPGPARRHSLHTPPAPIPADVKALYVAAGTRYRVPWPLLAGVGMEETHHGALTATSPAGARGLMQFMPATFAAYGVDGDGDGRAIITNDADSIHTAARYLAANGATRGDNEIRTALYAYNHADWYVDDVLFYARAYSTTGPGQTCAAAEPVTPPPPQPRATAPAGQ